jgi:hypothetical protein
MLLFYFIIFLHISICISQETNDDYVYKASLLQTFVEEPVTMEYMTAYPHDTISVLEWSCMTNTHAVGNSINNGIAIDYNHTDAYADGAFLRGTTIWVNEHMAVGHMMYDVMFIQAMQTYTIDRIVLQRAACIDATCHGIGTFESFFKGYYTAMINAFQPGIPIYIRFDWHETHAKPYYLSGVLNKPPKILGKINESMMIHLHNWKCGERFIKRQCMHCFHKGISNSAVVKFKIAAYNLVKPTREFPNNLIHHFSNDGPIIVSLCYRGKDASRHIENIDELTNSLTAALSSTQYKLRIINTSNNTLKYAEQIRWVASSHIVISEHGAFQSNIIYMRNSSLAIGLEGDYKCGEHLDFQMLAQIFGVYYASVKTKGLDNHREKKFIIKNEEISQIISIVRSYVQQKLFRNNVLLET